MDGLAYKKYTIVQNIVCNYIGLAYVIGKTYVEHKNWYNAQYLSPVQKYNAVGVVLLY